MEKNTEESEEIKFITKIMVKHKKNAKVKFVKKVNSSDSDFSDDSDCKINFNLDLNNDPNFIYFSDSDTE